MEAAPWWGALHERLVRSVKECLRAALQREKKTEAELELALIEAEAIINARPLADVSDDPWDPLPVTPAQLLYGYDNGFDPYPKDIERLTLRGVKEKWRQRLHLQEKLLRRFTKDYLQGLLPRKKWHKDFDGPREGELVFVEEPVKRLQWPMARVQEIHKGRDGQIRSVTLKTPLGVMRRPVQRLVPLEIFD